MFRNKAMGHAVCPSFIVNGDVIPESEKVKYIGHIICSDLKPNFIEYPAIHTNYS